MIPSRAHWSANSSKDRHHGDDRPEQIFGQPVAERIPASYCRDHRQASGVGTGRGARPAGTARTAGVGHRRHPAGDRGRRAGNAVVDRRRHRLRRRATISRRDQLGAVAVQAALVAAGSLAPEILAGLSRRGPMATRYLAVEGHRALAANERVVPPAVRAVIDRSLAARSATPATSLAIAGSRTHLDPTARGLRDHPSAAGPAPRPVRRPGDDAVGDTCPDRPASRSGAISTTATMPRPTTAGTTCRTRSAGAARSAASCSGCWAPPDRRAGASPGHRGPDASHGPRTVASPPAPSSHATGPSWPTMPASSGTRTRPTPSGTSTSGATGPTGARSREVEPRPRVPEPPTACRTGTALRRSAGPPRPRARAPAPAAAGRRHRHRRRRRGAGRAALAGSAPDEATSTSSSLRRRRDLSVLVLLDVSGSAGEPGAGGRTVHEHQRAAAAGAHRRAARPRRPGRALRLPAPGAARRCSCCG